MEVDGSRLGGLSGLDYDARADRWLAVSDDKAGPPRYYSIALDYDVAGIKGAIVTGVHRLALPARSAADLESLRLSPAGDRIWCASEGNADQELQPFIAVVRRDGTSPMEFPLPPGFKYSPVHTTGIRPNQAVESLTFCRGTGTLWTALEGPLLEDGPPADANMGASIRLTEQSRSGGVLRELIYPLEPVPGILAGGRKAANGVSEILSTAPDRLLVLERAGAEFGEGEWRFAVRLFGANVGTDQKSGPRLDARRDMPTVRKWLVFDFSDSGLYVDNLEGLAWGRKLANGHETLVLVSDDNFTAGQSTQLWIFELLPANPNRS